MTYLYLNPGNFSDISLPDLENSSGFGLTSHYTLPQIESYPHLLGMVYTLALINTKPEERKLVQSNWPETTLKVSLPNQENVSCKRGREIKISWNSSYFLRIKAKCVLHSAQEDLTQSPFSKCVLGFQMWQSHGYYCVSKWVTKQYPTHDIQISGLFWFPSLWFTHSIWQQSNNT